MEPEAFDGRIVHVRTYRRFGLRPTWSRACCRWSASSSEAAY